jgi:hypothetical protein
MVTLCLFLSKKLGQCEIGRFKIFDKETMELRGLAD